MKQQYIDAMEPVYAVHSYMGSSPTMLAATLRSFKELDFADRIDMAYEFKEMKIGKRFRRHVKQQYGKIVGYHITDLDEFITRAVNKIWPVKQDKISLEHAIKQAGYQI